jgi:1,4-dihydroxy-2-naphthoate octaprenyltransferase
MTVSPRWSSLWRLARPEELLAGFLLFSLGTAVARYQAVPIDPQRHAFGAALLFLIQLSLHFLQGYYQNIEQLASPAGRPTSSQWIDVLGRLPFLGGLFFLMLAVTLATVVVARGLLDPVSWILLFAFTTAAVLRFLPPIRLQDSGYGELIRAMAFVGIPPAFGYSLQTGNVDRLVFLGVVPLSALFFAMTIALELPTYAEDLRRVRGTLLVRLGWQTALRTHDVAILFAVILSAYGIAQGYPPRVSVGLLIALPLGLAQLWQVERVRRGYPPRWRTMRIVAVGMFAVPLYLHLAGYLLSLA